MRRFGFSLCVLAALGCGSGSGTTEQHFDVATYNAGLAVGYVAYAEARAEFTTAALVEQPLEFVCVQEVWRQDHWDGLVAAAAERWPHSQRMEPRPAEIPEGEDVGPACSEAVSDPLEDCARAHCDGATDLANCVLNNCAAEFGAASQSDGCRDCLVANVGSGDLDVILEACGPNSLGGGGIAYQGSFGIGLLSRYALEDRDSLWFEDATINRRGVLYARVAGTPLGDLHVFCTHLTSVLSNLEYSGVHESWADEQAQQIARLLTWVNEKVADGNPTLVMGDLNTGPAVGQTWSAEVPENYDNFVEDGFSNAYVDEGAEMPCSWCGSNPLTGSDDASWGSIIDHVLYRELGQVVRPFSLLRETTVLPDDSSTPTEAEIETSFSDHYGVGARILYEVFNEG